MAFAIICGLFGLVIGSFLNVLVLRRNVKGLGGRSGCLSCGHELSSKDLIPIVSWCVLRGRCRYCGSNISIQYVFVESMTALLFGLIGYGVWSAVDYPEMVVMLIGYLAITTLLIAIAVYDLKHTIIPNGWVYGFATLAAIHAGVSVHMLGDLLVPTLLAGPAAALPFATLWLVSRGRWMGLGDAKLALGIGWFLGPIYAWIAILCAFLLGAAVSVGILLPLPHVVRFLAQFGITGLEGKRHRFTMTSEVAFGPFLISGFFLVWILLLYGIDPIDMYFNIFAW